ncbi:hypothetical protein CO112_03285 [Candidatus Dojkabacteria bacterium CG_4_9_14_3_um_filter_150_Dojkabacteria_WS6_41_13]|uniref:Uncharacterized protein n=1 Tax=Candidatus Dojkabacteria bacterium CG_4_10_14_0_2_um_filter_Dojkabacteria_WS6_41_15 TaxID=2014249 RepID=A0A2M7W1I3_9BACT|nr:MAG: hypothetical protein COZ14_00280 [Candidatus Dojkabacteria bacterium CG_4_10_14_3_um_filter_Dojkabacteria_WS6_41_9]PJA12264.1 MAG: hypothetical protein COX64_04825 [Candidatus Dojkabacteria bacterium CG_4_10_14_0_2_um_filter_Dojkabacteria_WS6_41_15]PJB22640.1 MAG: hypothetical protein CO112_03285 [Candidatus Dojkabacteria bacterium CG_4_9_14_3_um_filter_150_Dojkabacteria_WS6_41_13]
MPSFWIQNDSGKVTDKGWRPSNESDAKQNSLPNMPKAKAGTKSIEDRLKRLAEQADKESKQFQRNQDIAGLAAYIIRIAHNVELDPIGVYNKMKVKLPKAEQLRLAARLAKLLAEEKANQA